MDSEAFTADGLLVDGVVPGGMAEQAELRRGDRIVAIAGLPVRTLCELGVALRRAGAFDEVELVIVRGGETFTRTVTVVTHPREPGAI